MSFITTEKHPTGYVRVLKQIRTEKHTSRRMPTSYLCNNYIFIKKNQ